MLRRRYKNIPPRILNAVKELVYSIQREGFRIDRIILFGSYAKGTWLKTSDIDLIIVSRDFKNIPFSKRLDIINKIIFIKNITPFIEVLPYTSEEFYERINKSIVLRDASKYWIELTHLVD
ncbi:nucleotidyltransferase domain-containing protein [Staphylothermus marinus]|uniref:nucleotidyltransferase domain-containing protein n=1 Tax=Staphylothermus marinus TaxID=2280 RepID=UPI000323BD74|nr:nucleotidyltransferase domain-containing protein [Staphylothermus marinus]